MASRSITTDVGAPGVLTALNDYAEEHQAVLERASLQNGERVTFRGSTFTLSLNLYPSKTGGCKVVFDRPDDPRADDLTDRLSARPSEMKSSKSASSVLEPVVSGAGSWIGSDESGKGDYFGPLVVAAVAITKDNWRVLETLGVQDSKNLSDTRAFALAAELRPAFPNDVVVIMPPRYNQLWSKFGNVNKLLAWAHARAIENVVEKSPQATAAVADQFGDEALIRESLFRRGRMLRLVQMHRA